MQYGLNSTGFTPQKALSEKLKAMGISSVDQLQGTTKAIFDQVSTPSTEQTFFNQNRSLPETNFFGRFGVGEAMILQRISFITSSFQGVFGLSSAEDAYYNIRIGNTNVIENFPIKAGLISVGGVKGGNPISAPYGVSLDFSSLLLLPPDTDFEVKLNLYSLGEDASVLCVVEGTAVELNTKF